MNERDKKYEISRLGYYLNRAFSGIVDAFDKALTNASLPLNHAQFLILKTLSRNPKGMMSQREIASQLRKDPAAISRTLKHIEENGLIERKQVNGCKYGVILTDKYFSLQPRIEKVIEEVTTSYCKGLAKEEIQQGLNFLVKIIDHL